MPYATPIYAILTASPKSKTFVSLPAKERAVSRSGTGSRIMRIVSGCTKKTTALFPSSTVCAPASLTSGTKCMMTRACTRKTAAGR